uniref:Uncharacterized protein n=1 Tax=Cyclopterus lumpus TaxID=8103 RepID=A0A8C2ZUH7_CYCLU
MKLGLLVVLAMAVLVPSLSEGRTVSRCELKEKLQEVLELRPGLQPFKEKILSIEIKRKIFSLMNVFLFWFLLPAVCWFTAVICEVNRRSML